MEQRLDWRCRLSSGGLKGDREDFMAYIMARHHDVLLRDFMLIAEQFLEQLREVLSSYRYPEVRG